MLFTNSSVILTSEDEGLGHDRLYRSEEDAYSGPSSLDSSEKKLKIKNNELDKKSLDKKSLDKVDRCTSPLMNVNELELRLSKLEKHNNELIEQNLELEEAENDSRLVSQKLKIKVDNLLEQIDNLQINLEQNEEYLKANDVEFKRRENKLIEQIKELQIKLDEERNISLSTINSSDDWQLDHDHDDCKLSTLNSLNDFDLNRSETQLQQQQEQNPICDSIKPIKIDLCNSNNTNANNEQLDSLDCLSNNLDINQTSLINHHSIDLHLKALETNQEELNDRLKHLQNVNKEFVKDLEQREHLLTKKELLFKEWITKESILRRNIVELNNELDELNKQFNNSQRQRAELRIKCEELHHQLIELENDATRNGHELSLSTRQKEMHELIVNCKQQEYNHRLIELMNKFKMQFDAHAAESKLKKILI